MKHTVSLGLVLLALWLLLSGLYNPMFVVFGLASTALVLWIALRMDLADHEGHPIHLSVRTWRYWPWLLKEMAKANLDVARRVLSRGPDISPCTFKVRALQASAVGRTTFANSITLTPGTVSMGIDGEVILVHALTQESKLDLEGGTMNRRVLAFEGPSRREGAAPTTGTGGNA